MEVSVKQAEDLLGVEEYDIARKVQTISKNEDMTTVKPNETQVQGWKNSQMSMPSGLPTSDLKMMETLSKIPKLDLSPAPSPLKEGEVISKIYEVMNNSKNTMDTMVKPLPSKPTGYKQLSSLKDAGKFGFWTQI